jgi:hypothetical protein
MELACHCPDDACGWRCDSSLCGETLDGMLMCPRCENAAVVPDGVSQVCEVCGLDVSMVIFCNEAHQTFPCPHGKGQKR